MVEEVRGGEREEHEAGGEPQPLQEIAACQDVHVPDHRVARGLDSAIAGALRECHNAGPSPRLRGEG